MLRHSFRPQLEQLEGRYVPSASPALSINSVALPASMSGQTAFVFTVSMIRHSSSPVSVNYATADGFATAAEGDYVPTSGTLTFAPGQTSQTITVLVNADPVGEPDADTFFVNLSGARNAVIRQAQGVGTMQDNHPRAVNEYYYLTDQYTPISGNVLAGAYLPTGAPAGDTLTVSTINGSAANVGNQITLATGAPVTVNAERFLHFQPQWHERGRQQLHLHCCRLSGPPEQHGHGLHVRTRPLWWLGRPHQRDRTVDGKGAPIRRPVGSLPPCKPPTGPAPPRRSVCAPGQADLILEQTTSAKEISSCGFALSLIT